MTRRLTAALAVVGGLVVSLASVPHADATGATTPATVAAPAATTASGGSTTASVPDGWEAVATPPTCLCSDGSPFTYFIHRGSTDKVMLFFAGGGACFSADTCGPDSKLYKRTLGPNDPPPLTGDVGIFDLSNPKNPVKDYSIVFVPYCTGDVHIGNKTTDYGNGVVIQHKGYVNGTTAVAGLAAAFPDAGHVLVTGESAGSVPDPLYAGLVHDALPTATITVLGDGSGAYPDVPAVNQALGTVWGTADAIPAWPQNAGLTPATWSFPGLYVQAHKHDPQIVFARHDYAYDGTQAAFAGLAGISSDNLLTLIDKNEQQIEASGAVVNSYIAPGTEHTLLHRPEFYTEKVNGVLFVDWMTLLLSGTAPGDVHCTVCKA